jgi:hypothetical protein
MKEAPGSSETPVLTRATRRNNPEYTILHSHRRENLKSYINKIDILLVLESHATEHTFVKMSHYTIHYANHPDGTAQAGSAIIIKSTLKHYVLEPFVTNRIQGTILRLEALSGPVTIAAVYSAPRHSISAEEYDHFLSQLGTYYLVACDWKAKKKDCMGIPSDDC